MRRVLLTILVLLRFGVAPAGARPPAEFYASPTGRAGGDGSSSNPWDLQTALHQPPVVQPGDTIWLRGGTYHGNFSCELTGTAIAPIYVRQFPAEHVILDGAASGTAALQIAGASYAWFWGFEITSLGSQLSRYSAQSGPFPTDLPFCGGVDADLSTGIRLINLIIHDTRTGLDLWTPAKDLEVRGCLIYYNGWWGDRAHGHGIYTQNQQPSYKKIFDNIVFNNSSHGMQVYGSEIAYLDNYDLQGNAWINNGYLFNDANGRNLLIGGGRISNNAQVQDNYLYRGPPQADSADFYLGFQTGSNNALLRNNYLVGSATFDGAISNLQLESNTFYGAVTGINPSNYPGNTYTATQPTGVKVFVRPSPYEAGRAHLVIYNWDLLSAVNVNIAAIGLGVGQDYELHNAANFYNDVSLGTYTGSPISIPMTGHSVATPSGLPAQPSTFPGFGVFVIMKRGPGSSNTPPTISPVANQSIAPGTTTDPIPFTVGDAQTAAADLTVTVSSSNPALVPDGNIQLGGSSASRTLTITPLIGQIGTTTITLTVSDGQSSTQTSFVLTVDTISITAGLVGYWTFDTADTSGNTLLDRSGFGSNATADNTTVGVGKLGQALHFNGANAYAPVAPDSNFALTGDRTLSLWIRTISSGRFEGIISRYDAAGAESGYLLRTTPSGMLSLRVGGNNLPFPSGGLNASDTHAINDGLWHQVGATIKLGTGVSFFIDGVRTTTTALNIQAGDAGVAQFQFGRNPFLEYGDYFNGDLDQARVYNRILSDGEMAALFQEGNAGDTIPEWWTQQYFGHPAGQASDLSRADDDADGDGQSNLAEYITGTNPRDSSSVLRITASQPSGNDFIISFPTVVGKTYRVERKDTVADPAWTVVADKAGTGGTVQATDPGGAAQPRRFYRVRFLP